MNDIFLGRRGVYRQAMQLVSSSFERVQRGEEVAQNSPRNWCVLKSLVVKLFRWRVLPPANQIKWEKITVQTVDRKGTTKKFCHNGTTGYPLSTVRGQTAAIIFSRCHSNRPPFLRRIHEDLIQDGFGVLKRETKYSLSCLLQGILVAHTFI